MTENGGRGIRHHFVKDYSAIYVYNLKGGYSGAHNVFGIPYDIAITFLIKKSKQLGKANIYYSTLDELTKRKERIEIIKNTKSVANLDFKKIIPNPYDDWLNQRVEFPEHYIPVYAKKGGVVKEEGCFFRTNSNGLLTGNDAKHVNFSKAELQKQMATLTDNLTEENFRIVSYRPFTKVNAYRGKLSRRTYSTAQFSPYSNFENKIFYVAPLHNESSFSIIVVREIPDIVFMGGKGGGLCFPLKFVPEANTQNNLLLFNKDSEEQQIQDGLSDWILFKAQEKYSSKVTKEDLFHYVYGFLHSPIYRKKYANTLTKQAPNIPLIKEGSFWQYVKIGKELMDLHLDYENQPKLHEVKVSGQENRKFKIGKMIYKEGSNEIKFNEYITISNIPSIAYDYTLNGKSAVWWVMNQYQVNRPQSAHKTKRIPNDPNIYAQEIDRPRYILDLLLSVITLSVKTLESIEQLPKDIE
ncbi:MAG: hypothetical protein OXC64_05905 [Flavobacteriaceae bacterium]|nr:hypothetical protein [Flavobacteriaceae bacterium]